MRSPPLPVRAAALVAVLAAPVRAAADLPGKPICDPSVRGCTECWKPYAFHDKLPDDAVDDAKNFEACQAAAQARGLAVACVTKQQGAGDSYFFCPPGVTMKTIAAGGAGGGCAGCSVGGAAPGAVGAAGGGALLAGLRRRRRGRAASGEGRRAPHRD
jgi:hypothetical protein